MMNQRPAIQWAKIERIDTPTLSWEQYEYRPELGWRWLQKMAFAVLGWIGAHHMPTVTTFTRTPEENDGLLKSLLGQEGQWIELVHRSRDNLRIYMGPDEHADLMSLCEHRHMIDSTFVGRIETRDNYAGKWHDIPITVVPWMIGAIIVPA